LIDYIFRFKTYPHEFQTEIKDLNFKKFIYIFQKFPASKIQNDIQPFKLLTISIPQLLTFVYTYIK